MNAPKERILVTGAAGFIGSHLTDRLLALGHQVVGLDNFDPFYPASLKRQNLAAALAHPGFKLVEGDCAVAADVERAFEPGIDVIVHLAAKAGVRPSIQDPLGYTRANVVATQMMLEAARKHQVHRFVFGSSSSVYGNNEKVPFSETDPVDHPISPYAATKRTCELICHTYHHLFGMGVLSLRRPSPSTAMVAASAITRGSTTSCRECWRPSSVRACTLASSKSSIWVKAGQRRSASWSI
jgi:nucleoside-diphosphate-sugar epimerase